MAIVLKNNIKNIYVIEYYSAIKKNEILPFVTTWMELATSMLSKISQRKKYHMISLMWNLRSKTGEHRGKKDEPGNRLNYRE